MKCLLVALIGCLAAGEAPLAIGTSLWAGYTNYSGTTPRSQTSAFGLGVSVARGLSWSVDGGLESLEVGFAGYPPVMQTDLTLGTRIGLGSWGLRLVVVAKPYANHPSSAVKSNFIIVLIL